MFAVEKGPHTDLGAANRLPGADYREFVEQTASSAYEPKNLEGNEVQDLQPDFGQN
jgi:hypothetical protein